MGDGNVVTMIFKIKTLAAVPVLRGLKLVINRCKASCRYPACLPHLA